MVEFCVLTDHKPLTSALVSHSVQHSPRQIRHLDFISQFTGDILHVQIEVNVLASHHEIDFEGMEKAQAGDPNLATVKSSPSLKHNQDSVPLSF